MSSSNIKITDNGGIEIIVTDDNGIERSITFEPNDDGTIDIQGRGPNGESERGTIAPGQGNSPLGQ